jgi:hypothetical protein
MNNGKSVKERTPEAWSVLDEARFHLLPSKPGCFESFTNLEKRAAYEILSRTASDVLFENYVSRRKSRH